MLSWNGGGRRSGECRNDVPTAIFYHHILSSTGIIAWLPRSRFGLVFYIMSLPTYILAGGQSRRFGSDKARAVLHDEPLIARLAGRFKGLAGEIVVVADRPDKYADLGLTTIADRVPGQGPLGGLETALSDALERSDSAWILLASCDLADIRGAWIETLTAELNPHGRARAFRGEFWHPFPGLYHTKLMPLVGEYLASPKASFQRLLSDPRANAAALPLPADWPAVAQVNTREDLEQVAGDHP